ncbi:MAG: BrnA antitoxin family protein [Microcystis aeruginosa G13-12]|jgi:uncharacterized protein (DUF4415 family)|nr:BrnA antitoxin family protein [Microcystis aeruginosa SX13-01]NCS08722.1 BrnA antitoxin family protein [Microcystis aeruginosa G13-07]NCS17599.1 BrnA antitoxin family protein [Microcystis aeruginosa G13-12]NCT53007.1 BrnA antitoxin family protein [Microcystis aeruginosa G13-03]
MKGGLMKKGHSNPVPPEIQAEIDALAASKEPIRTDLIPEATGDWSEAQRGVFYRPLKQQITLSLDADLIDWFKTHATEEEGYQTSINRALREYVETRAKN